MSFGRLLARAAVVGALLILGLRPVVAEVRTICTIAADVASGQILVEEGDCDMRASPASTFKVPISLMGFDAGILESAGTPRWDFRKGYPDWRQAWRQPADPARWMRESVVWFSQQVTLRLGARRFSNYVRQFDYGNRDISGAPGRDGLTQAWLDTSLRISPREQIAFLRGFLGRDFGVSDHAYAMTRAIIDQGRWPGEWHVFGKTGTTGAPERRGWFVGWAEKSGRSIVFARLTASDRRPATPLGPAALNAVRRDLFASGRFG